VGGTVAAYTDHDQALIVSGTTYNPFSVGNATDVVTGNAFNPDTLDIGGDNSSAGITAADLRAGKWDFASFVLFAVNYADLTQGTMILRTGTIGEVTMERGEFKAELRGLIQSYSRGIGQLTSPSCRADFGDVRCGVDTSAYTVTGTIDSVGADNVTLYDAARTEAGPTGGTAISNVTRANPGRITLATALRVPNGTPVSITGVTGMTTINTITVLTNGASDYLSFDLSVDTRAFTAYAGGGTVIELGSDSGYFDFGLITFTSGLNDDLSMEIKAYAVGQITLHLPMPYTVAAGDAYTLRAGCDKSLATCRDRYDNVVNFRGEPYIPGIDKMLAVGRK